MKRIKLPKIVPYFFVTSSIAPLITFRIVFGGVMLFSALRFIFLGWIEDHFIHTRFTFKYFGFEWVQVLPPAWMYVLHLVLVLSALGILLGFAYRLSAILHFCVFTYIELIDLTYYLNHYYFVSLISFLLIWVPAHRRFSLDSLIRPGLRSDVAPKWSIDLFKFQIAIVYLYAGLAKINHDWLIEALPLKIWLPANDALPLIGPLFRLPITPYIFSWLGMLYDISIVFWLSMDRTRIPAYLSVIVFHGITGMIFQIGVFPLVMIGATWIFFSIRFHEKLLSSLERLLPQSGLPNLPVSNVPATSGFILYGMIMYVVFQLVFPWRYVLYPGNVFWTEEGYRFSWRVMLMEKAGTATFYVKDGQDGREGVVDNTEFLRPHQEKQMAMQADMILQYAHFLARHYEAQGMAHPQVRVEAYVTLNARPSKLLIDPRLDLTKIQDGWSHKSWILPYEN